MKKQEKAKALKKIAAELKRSDCPLRKSATQPVAGKGNPNAKVVFIGEAPGRHEDEQGKPFVGAAGKVLDELLQEAGLKRSQVFITSIEKFRPPKNRDPKSKEIEACLPFLIRQLAVIKPKLIVPLGRHALAAMYEMNGNKPKRSMLKDVHGKLIRSEQGWTIYPVYHPASILHRRSLKTTLLRDFRKIPSVLKNL